MAANSYHFITRWRLRATPEQVYDIISEPLEFSRWWPSVYLGVEELEHGDAGGTGRRVRFHTRGWLPYTLRWESRATEAVRPRRLAICATGDFDGTGVWMFEPDREFVRVTFDWKLKAEKPLLRYLSFLLKPVFSANHRWAMKRGEESLRLELARLSALTDL